MKTIRYLSVGLCMLLSVEDRCHGAITATATRGSLAADLDGMISSSDLLDGLIATELPGDNGWHPANPASGNPSHPDGLAAFTDGAGNLSGVTGLLNDFPNAVENFGDPLEEDPTKVIQYDLAGSVDIDQINIFTGNPGGDGRIFSTFVIRVSTDNGANYSPLGGLVPNFPPEPPDPPIPPTPNTAGYYQSDASGLINNQSGIPGTTDDEANLVEIFDDGAASIATGVTNLQFWFYSADNTLGENRDPFDGVNPFTGVDDGLTAAIQSPLVWEIDVLGQASAGPDPDVDGDSDVDGKDFLEIQRTDPSLIPAWESEFGNGVGPLAGLASVPEPTSAMLSAAALVYAAVIRRRRI